MTFNIRQVGGDNMSPPYYSEYDNLNDHDLLVEIRAKIEGIVKSNDDHEERIRRLERWRWKQVGVVSLISSVIGSGGVISVLKMIGVF